MKILIATGIFPPEIGGPAQYAKEIRDEFQKQGNSVSVLTYKTERNLPTGIRHLLFFFRTFFSLLSVELVLALDTFSVGFPAVFAAKLLGKKIIIRTGGDFLWEGYVERTGDLVLFREFYNTRKGGFSLKERIIFALTRWTLRNASAVAFSTKWQEDIFIRAYGLEPKKCFVVENFYGLKIPSVSPQKKNFVSGTRPLKWKNREGLKRAFEMAKKEASEISLDEENLPYERFVEKIANSYAVILVSLGDISPNMILDSIRSNTPFILSKENGLMPRIQDIGIFVDPNDAEDIKKKILFLADTKNWETCRKKIESFTFTHGWDEICREFIAIYQKI